MPLPPMSSPTNDFLLIVHSSEAFGSVSEGYRTDLSPPTSFGVPVPGGIHPRDNASDGMSTRETSGRASTRAAGACR